MYGIVVVYTTLILNKNYFILIILLYSMIELSVFVVEINVYDFCWSKHKYFTNKLQISRISSKVLLFVTPVLLFLIESIEA